MGGWRRGAICAFFFLLGVVPAVANAAERCTTEKPYAGDEFFFDELRFHFGKKQATDAMKPLESYEGQIHASWAASDDCGNRGWWPSAIAIPFSVGHQALIGILERGRATKISGTAYELGLAFRWCFLPGTLDVPDSQTCVAYDDTHWSTHPGDPIALGGQELTLPEYIALHDVDLSRFQSAFDVFSLQLMHRLTPVSRFAIEGRVGYNLFQSDPLDFLGASREHYPYPWFVEGQAAWRIINPIAIVFTEQAEWSSDNTPNAWRAAIETRLPGLPTIRFFYRSVSGIKEDALVSTRWGIWSASPMYGIEMVTDSE